MKLGAWMVMLAVAGGALAADGTAEPGQVVPAGPRDVAKPTPAIGPAGEADARLATPGDPTQELMVARQQLDAILAENGLLTRAARQDQAARLERIADLGNTLQRRVPAAQQLAASDLELRANYALAQNARAANQEREASYRMGKLRSAAVHTRNLRTPGAAVLGDFWIMQADLFDLGNADLDVDTRQRETIKRLEAFVREHGSVLERLEVAPVERAPMKLAGVPAPPPPVKEPAVVPEPRDKREQIKELVEGIVMPKHPAPERRAARPAPDSGAADRQDAAADSAPPRAQAVKAQGVEVEPFVERAVVIDVQLALLRLYDERGMSEQACQLLDALKTVAQRDGDGTLQAELERWYGYSGTIGRTFASRLPTVDGSVWSSADHAGEYILLHFWADWYQPSVEAFGVLREAKTRLGSSTKLAIVSVNLGNAAEVGDVDWPVTQGLVAREQLAELFAVRTLPRYVLIDAKGVVVAVGGSPAILEQVREQEDAAAGIEQEGAEGTERE